MAASPAVSPELLKELQFRVKHWPGYLEVDGRQFRIETGHNGYKAYSYRPVGASKLKEHSSTMMDRDVAATAVVEAFLVAMARRPVVLCARPEGMELWDL